MPTALIVGGNSDIGLAIARQFASHGYDIQLTARTKETLVASQSDLKIRHPIDCTIYSFEAEDTASHAAFLAALRPLPDICVYAIGYMGVEENILKSTAESQAIIAANYQGAVSLLNQIAGAFAAQKKGTIIGISSVAGDRGRQQNLVYGSAKAAFSAYLSGLRNYLTTFQVHVITVKPGFVYTKMTNHLNLPPLLTASPRLVAKRVFHAYQKKKNVIYVKGIWRWIMLIIRHIPESIFKKMNL